MNNSRIACGPISKLFIEISYSQILSAHPQKST